MTKFHTLLLLTFCSLSPFARADDAADARATAAACNAAIDKGDYNAAADCTTGDPKQLAEVKVMCDHMTALTALRVAAEKRFGPEGVDVANEFAMTPSQCEAAFKKATVKVTGNKATLREPNERQANTTLVKISGEWKVAGLSASPNLRDVVIWQWPMKTNCLDTTRQGIEAGKYATLQDAKHGLEVLIESNVVSAAASRPTSSAGG